LDSADFRGIDTIREVRRAMLYCAQRKGSCRVWILDEVHQLSKDAQSALLKALEDTPAHVWFLLATTDPEKLLPTIRSRCTMFALEPLRPADVEALLRQVATAEQGTLSPDAERVIVERCNGSARAALVALDAVLHLPPSEQAAAVAVAEEEREEAIALARAIFNRKPWGEIARLLKAVDAEPESIRRLVLQYMSSVLMNAGPGPRGNQAWLILDAFRRPFYDTGKPGLIAACFEALCGGAGGR
jgi:DNA polymerase III gamma/tau subunit